MATSSQVQGTELRNLVSEKCINTHYQKHCVWIHVFQKDGYVHKHTQMYVIPVRSVGCIYAGNFKHAQENTAAEKRGFAFLLQTQSVPEYSSQ